MRCLRSALAIAIATVAVVGRIPVASATDIDKYTQTWSTPYAETTCAAFMTQMTDMQRWVLAADVLTAARNTKQNTGLPSDSMITEFEQGLESVCDVDSMVMTDAGRGLYMTEPRYQPNLIIHA